MSSIDIGAAQGAQDAGVEAAGPPAPPEAPARSVIVGWVVLGAVALLVVATLFLWKRSPEIRAPEPLPVLGWVPDFQLQDQDGRAFGLDDLRGKVWVADFVFTHCASACPQMMARMLRVQEAVKSSAALRSAVRLVSFSVDPERDSTERLRAYAGDIGADTSLWSFVTGAQGVVSQLCQTAFQLASGTLDADGAQVSPEGHSDRFVLVDRKGTIRGYYRPVAGEPEVARLLADLERLVAEGAR